MAAEVKLRQNRFQVRRTQLPGSTRSFAAGSQAKQFGATWIVALIHCGAAYRRGRRPVQSGPPRFYLMSAARKLQCARRRVCVMNQQDIDSRVVEWAARKRLPGLHLERWLSREPDEQKILLELAEGLHLRTAQFVTICELLDEIGVRERLGLAALLALPSLAHILSSDGSGPGRAVRLLAALRAMRYPRLHEAQAQAAAQLRALKLPANVRVSWPANLSGELKVELLAHGGEELAAALDALAAHRAALCALAEALG